MRSLFKFRRGRRGSGCGVERLEARCLLSCTATQKGGTLTIQGSSAADLLELHDDGQKNIKVSCAGNDHDDTFGGITKINVQMAAGDDVLKYFLEPNSTNVLIGLLIPAVLTVDLGKGADQFELLGMPLGNPNRSSADGVQGWSVSVNGGVGDDRLSLSVDTSLWQQGAAVKSFFDVFADLGAGQDQFLMHMQDASTPSVSGEPAESFSLNFAKVKVAGGTGDDVMELGLQKVGRGMLQLSGGAGDDIVLLHHKDWLPDSFFDVFVDLGTGGDQLQATLGTRSDQSATTNSGSLGLVKMKVDAGDGDDTIDLTLNDTHTAAVSVQGGRGNDLVTGHLHGFVEKGDSKDSSLDLFVDLGIGNDQLLAGFLSDASEPSESITLNFAKIKVVAGDGDDVVDLELRNTREAHFDLNGGRGNDVVNIKAESVPINSFFDVFVDLGIGDDQLSAITRNGMTPLIDSSTPNVAKVKVDAGDGDDVVNVVMEQVREAHADLHGGRGNDLVTIKAESLPINGSVNVFVDLGIGNDQLLAGIQRNQIPSESPTLAFAKIKVAAGDGDDVVDLELQNVRETTLDIQGGRGNDIVFMKYGIFQESVVASVDAGIGNDQVHAQIGGVGGAATNDYSLSFSRLNINAGDGDDQVDLNLENVIQSELNFVGGKGNDLVGVNVKNHVANATLNVLADLGAGDDEWMMTTGATVKNTPGAPDVPLQIVKVEIHAGVGDDDVGVDLQNLKDAELHVFGDAGHDDLSIVAILQPPQTTTATAVPSAETAPRVVPWVIDGGLGNDTIAMTLKGPLAADHHLMVLGGAGMDHLRASIGVDSGSPAKLNVEVLGGDHNDDLALEVFGGESLASLLAVLDGGAGMDTCRATPNVQIRNCEDGLTHN